MIFDPDHMSVKARQQSLDLIDAAALPRRGVQPLVVHPGRLPADLRRAGASSRRTPGTAPASSTSGSGTSPGRTRATYWGFGFGADINGLGAQGDPRPGRRGQPGHLPVHRPRRGAGRPAGQRPAGLRHQQDGVAHYGLYPDWIEDLRKIAGDDIVDRHGPRPRGLPADVGAGLRRRPRTRAPTPEHPHARRPSTAGARRHRLVARCSSGSASRTAASTTRSPTAPARARSR